MMHFIEILHALPNKQATFNRFSDFLASPYHNTNENARKVFVYLKPLIENEDQKVAIQREGGKFKKDEIGIELFPETYSSTMIGSDGENSLDVLYAHLKKCLKQFLILEYYHHSKEKDKNVQLNWLKVCRSTAGFEKEAVRTLERLEKTLDIKGYTTYSLGDLQEKFKFLEAKYAST